MQFERHLADSQAVSQAVPRHPVGKDCSSLSLGPGVGGKEARGRRPEFTRVIHLRWRIRLVRLRALLVYTHDRHDTQVHSDSRLSSHQSHTQQRTVARGRACGNRDPSLTDTCAVTAISHPPVTSAATHRLPSRVPLSQPRGIPYSVEVDPFVYPSRASVTTRPAQALSAKFICN